MNKNRRNFVKLIATSPLGILIPKSLQAKITKNENCTCGNLEKYKWEFKDRPWIVWVTVVPDNTKEKFFCSGYKYVIEVKKVESIRGRRTERQQCVWEDKETETVQYALIIENSIGERLLHQTDLYETEKEAVEAVLNSEAFNSTNWIPKRKKFLKVYHEDGNISKYKLKKSKNKKKSQCWIIEKINKTKEKIK